MSLWQRNDTEPPVTRTSTDAQPVSAPSTPRENRMEKLVNIGQSIAIKGELTGNEDLTIDGKVDGKILLKDHNLTIGANGKISAELHAKTVIIIGEVVGNITADDKIEVAASGAVQGDLRAPRVVISDGARFKGSIDMERRPQPGGAAAGANASSGMTAGSPGAARPATAGIAAKG